MEGSFLDLCFFPRKPISPSQPWREQQLSDYQQSDRTKFHSAAHPLASDCVFMECCAEADEQLRPREGADLWYWRQGGWREGINQYSRLVRSTVGLVFRDLEGQLFLVHTILGKKSFRLQLLTELQFIYPLKLKGCIQNEHLIWILQLRQAYFLSVYWANYLKYMICWKGDFVQTQCISKISCKAEFLSFHSSMGPRPSILRTLTMYLNLKIATKKE